MKRSKDESQLLIQAIHRVIEWLESLLDLNNMPLNQHSLQSKRVFSPEEQDCFSLESQHYLLTLEQQGLLTPVLRERIIHHAMLLDVKIIELPVVEGITRLVLGQHPEIMSALVNASKLSLCNRSIH